MKFSPSKAHRWIGGGCTGSVKAEAAALPVPSSPQASEGTRLHALAAAILLGEAEVIDTAPGDWEIIGPYIEDVWKAKATYGGELRVEHKVEHPDYGRGYLDTSLLTITRLIVWDLKTGYRPVEVRRNWQLLLGAIMMNPGPGVSVELRIVQQPGYHPDGPVRTWAVPDLAFYRILAERARQEALNEPMLVATPSNCLYCKAVTSCSSARNVTLGGMDLAMGGVGPIDASAIRTELVTLRNTDKLVRSRLAALEAEAEERMRLGENIPGCAMQAGRAGSLAWSADNDKVRAVCAMVGQSADSVSLRTPAQMIKAGVPKELVASVTKRNSSKTSVATDADETTRKLFS